MNDRAKALSVHRIPATELYADPARFGFEPCGCDARAFDRECDRCGGLGLVRVVQPCVGCGHCCLATPCVPAMIVAARRDPDGPPVTARDRCPFLEWNGERYLCGLANETDPEIVAELGHGEGCCQPLNNWRSDVRFRG